MSLVYLRVFSSGVYLYLSILMYVKRHEQFEIGCGAILNKIYYYYYPLRQLDRSNIVQATYISPNTGSAFNRWITIGKLCARAALEMLFEYGIFK